jgi:hypothetical protein
MTDPSTGPMTELYAAWLAAPHKTATLQAVTEHFRNQLPPDTQLGKPCRKHGHTWNGTPWCIRKHSHCVVCHPLQQLLDPEERRQRRIKAKRSARAAAGATPLLERQLEYAYHRAIKAAGQYPSVADLVMAEQRRYWREHPDDQRTELNRCKRHEWRLMYLTRPELRRYNREKSKRRKARLRGNHVIHVTASQIRQRFAQFDHACCYCGARGDLHQEHFLPISKGGTHVLSNLLPACQPCNYSKRDYDPEAWYRAQPFFTEQRWRLILSAMGKRRAPVGQLALL